MDDTVLNFLHTASWVCHGAVFCLVVQSVCLYLQTMPDGLKMDDRLSILVIHRKGGNSLKVKLSVSQDRYDEIKNALLAHGIEIEETADLVLSESNRYLDTLLVKELKTNQQVFLSIQEIVSIEAFGHSVEVFTQNKSYQLKERLYKIEALLDPEKFLRVSHSVVIAKDKVKAISPTLSMKFIVTMSDTRTIVVTRSYYYIFRESFGI